MRHLLPQSVVDQLPDGKRPLHPAKIFDEILGQTVSCAENGLAEVLPGTQQEGAHREEADRQTVVKEAAEAVDRCFFFDCEQVGQFPADEVQHFV